MTVLGLGVIRSRTLSALSSRLLLCGVCFHLCEVKGLGCDSV